MTTASGVWHRDYICPSCGIVSGNGRKDNYETHLYGKYFREADDDFGVGCWSKMSKLESEFRRKFPQLTKNKLVSYIREKNLIKYEYRDSLRKFWIVNGEPENFRRGLAEDNDIYSEDEEEAGDAIIHNQPSGSGLQTGPPRQLQAEG